MRIELTGKHLEITEAIREHVIGQLAKLDSFFQGRDSDVLAHVVVTVEKNRQIAEIVINWREHVLKATETGKDLYLVLSKTIDKLEKQARRVKDKTVKRKHLAESTAVVAPEPDGEVKAAPLPARVILAPSYQVKPMTPDEAVIALNQDHHQFIVFRDAETEFVSILYKRKDGNYGLIQP
jgi:putative sigma-54 modulation protein